MKPEKLLYEGKAKKVFATADPERYVVEYKDDATAFNGKKKGTIEGKGEINNKMSAIFFTMLAEHGVPTHFEKLLGPTQMLVKAVQIIPVEVIVRNIAAGSLAQRLGVPEGTPMKTTVLEFCYKSDELGDPMVNEYHIAAMGWATPEEMELIKKYSLKVNQVLRAFLKDRGIELVDFKLEYGRHKGDVILADEISPDTCRFWDAKTHEKLDKDRFRRDLGGVEQAYREVLGRLTGDSV